MGRTKLLALSSGRKGRVEDRALPPSEASTGGELKETQSEVNRAHQGRNWRRLGLDSYCFTKPATAATTTRITNAKRGQQCPAAPPSQHRLPTSRVFCCTAQGGRRAHALRPRTRVIVPRMLLPQGRVRASIT